MVNKPDYDPNTPYEGYESFEGETENDQITKYVEKLAGK